MVLDSLWIKAILLEEGIRIMRRSKDKLDRISNNWLMDDYITASGISISFLDQYATIKSNESSAISLDYIDGTFYILFEGHRIPADVILPPPYMDDKIVIGDKTITNYVNTYTDRIRIQTMCGCANDCKFCNACDYGYSFNDIDDIDEAFKIALEQSNARHAFVSTNNVKDEKDLVRLTKVMEYFCNKYPEMHIDVMTSPRGFDSYTDNSQYLPYLKHLKQAGITGIAVNMELYDEDLFEYYCPRKSKIGKDNYIDFIKKSVQVFGVGNVRSALIVGLEPIENTLKGVELLAEMKCIPVLSPLYPYGEAQGNTTAELFYFARKKSEEICKKHGIPMGPICIPCAHNSI